MGSKGRVVVVARVAGIGGGDLCAFIVDGGGIKAAVNAAFEDEAIAHILAHVEAGVTDVQLCSRDCSVAEGGHQDAADH